MELLREQQMQLSNAELEAKQHNAMIKERYRRLQTAVADQFAAVENAVHAEMPVKEETVTYINPSKANTAVLEQEPTVTEYISPMANALFTTEKFERLTVEEPVRPAAPVAKVQAVVSTQAQYSLSPFAKAAMAIFTMVIVAMLTMICINTHMLTQKRIKIQNLEQKKEQLADRYEDIQRRIEAAQSEEAIREYALSQGMVQSGN
ncbi:MAG: hypothetical protein IKB20_04990 [Clostridia bacterium]|nr:hypothetical protein [Clostridia bacterium]